LNICRFSEEGRKADAVLRLWWKSLGTCKKVREARICLAFIRLCPSVILLPVCQLISHPICSDIWLITRVVLFPSEYFSPRYKVDMAFRSSSSENPPFLSSPSSKLRSSVNPFVLRLLLRLHHDILQSDTHIYRVGTVSSGSRPWVCAGAYVGIGVTYWLFAVL
jgi:hypothetical protein